MSQICRGHHRYVEYITFHLIRCELPIGLFVPRINGVDEVSGTTYYFISKESHSPRCVWKRSFFLLLGCWQSSSMPREDGTGHKNLEPITTRGNFLR